MHISPQDEEILGVLPEKTLTLLRESSELIGHIKLKLGDMEIEKSVLIKRVDDIRYSLKVEEEKIHKRYGEGVILDISTGNILKGKSVLDTLVK